MWYASKPAASDTHGSQRDQANAIGPAPRAAGWRSRGRAGSGVGLFAAVVPRWPRQNFTVAMNTADGTFSTGRNVSPATILTVTGSALSTP